MVLKELSEKNLVEFTSNLLDYFKVIDNRLVINQYTSKDPESARDNVGWYRFDEGRHTVNLNIVNMLCAQFGIARGELDLESFYAFVTLCTGHEFRHFLQGTCIYDEKPIAAYAYCNLHGLWMDEVEKLPVCDLKPVDTNTSENYVVCKCNNVSYFDILDAIHGSKSIDSLLDVFENVKNTTKCSTGCGGCYDKVIKIVSESMSNG